LTLTCRLLLKEIVMPSFDVVSEVDKHELSNAVDQSNREISTRFDFKGSNAQIDIKDKELVLSTESEFQIRQMIDILHNKMVKRKIDIDCLLQGDVKETNGKAILNISVQQGIDADNGRKIIKLIKQAKMKVQSAMQDEQVRVTGKKRDDLQAAMKLIKDEGLNVPVQFTNFRD